MTQEDLEMNLLFFLRKEKGFVTDTQIAQWKIAQDIDANLSIEAALKSLLSQKYISLTDKGVIVL